MPAETSVTATESQPHQGKWDILSEQKNESLEQIVRIETVKDQHDFLRPRFVVDDKHSVVFRGREDLPIIEDGKHKVALTLDEDPVYTPKPQFEVWKNDNGSEDSVEEIEFLASSTPRGIIDAAIKLTQLGVGKPENLGHLQQLKAKIIESNCDDEVLEYFDSIYTAGGVDAESGKVNEYNSSTEGPMLVAMALAGNQEAIDLLNAKRQILDAYDEKRRAEYLPDKPIKAPGENLTEEELEVLRGAHFIAVHTSPTEPTVVDEKGTKGIYPTGEYDLGKPEHFPRETIHWSLDHTVESHMFGNFSGRKITIVDPLVDMARHNGSPAVLHGVDTYFSCNPGHPLVLSENASVIRIHEERDAPFVKETGQDVEIRAGMVTHSDLEQLGDFIYGDIDKDKYDIPSLLSWDLFSNGSLKTLQTHMIKRLNSPTEYDLTDPAAIEYLKPFKKAYELIKPDLLDNPSDEDCMKAVKQMFKKLVNGDLDVAEYPELYDEIIETTRILVAQKLIEAKGGKIAKSHSGSQRMIDEDFNDRERKVLNFIGIRSGLHENQLEALNEEIFADVRSKALNHYDDGSFSFVWNNYDDSDLWTGLCGASWQKRRYLVRSGMINFTPKKETKIGKKGVAAIPGWGD